jgi:DnaJ-class molecular chaperone
MDDCRTCGGSGSEYRKITHPAANVAGWFYEGGDVWSRRCPACSGNGVARSPVPAIRALKEE